MAPKKKGGKKRRKIDEKVAVKLQSSSRPPASTRRRRTRSELSEADVKALIDALDDDGSGSLSLDELADFVEHGTATFYADHAATEAADAGKRTTKWGAKDEPDEMKKLRRATAAKERKKKTLDEAEMAHFQMKLQAATFGHSPQELFKSFDKSGDGLLNAEELTHLIRADPEHAHKHHKWGERAEECEAAKEDRKARLAKKARPDFDPDEMKKLQGRLPVEIDRRFDAPPNFEILSLGHIDAATYGDDPLHIFRKFDATGDGVLDVPELTKMIRLELKISGSLVDLHTGIDELADFVQYGMDTFYADHEETEAKSQAGGHKKGLGWGERAANPACMTVDPGPGDDEASHVSGLSHEGSSLATADNPTLEKTAARIHDDDGGPAGAPPRALLDDPLLRLYDCGLEPALRAFRASIVAEAPNNVATATAL
ncbi:hypothetical protein JL720_15164 [Aureococcus anophagefferens]|nr:hypothetical protein JL720_15164 [Aureococcus anophagefferens]